MLSPGGRRTLDAVLLVTTAMVVGGIGWMSFVLFVHFLTTFFTR